ncbi:hypothetical protein D9M68_101410 [compost metagenome]
MTQILTTAPDVLKDSRQLYNAHRSAANKPSKVENLDKVWEVLNAIRDEGGRDYSLAEVGRRLERLGGPKTQSLRNAQGADYREIISAYANAVSGSTRYVAKTKSNVEQALDLITDPSIRATIRVALDEAKRLKVVNDNLHAAFKSIQVGATLPQAAAPVAVPQAPAPRQEGASLSPRLLNALRKGIDASRLAQQGLRIEEDGSIENDHGDKVFPVAFATAIHTILEGNAPPPSP